MALSRLCLVPALAVAVSGILGIDRPLPATASCAATPSLARAVARAPVVFVGKVIRTRNHSLIATVRVLDVWRGKHVGKVVTVQNDSMEDSRSFRLGVTYLFFPVGLPVASTYYDDACSATRHYSRALARYRPHGAHRP